MFKVILFVVSLNSLVYAKIEIVTLSDNLTSRTIKKLSREVNDRTSINLNENVKQYKILSNKIYSEPWIWLNSLSKITDANSTITPPLGDWLKKGGFLILQGTTTLANLNKLTVDLSYNLFKPEWNVIETDHEIMRSFYLLDSLPECAGNKWMGLKTDGRLAILNIPFDFIAAIEDDQPRVNSCLKNITQEQLIRIYTNIILVALTTDYKKDQIHLPEILKRLRK